MKNLPQTFRNRLGAAFPASASQSTFSQPMPPGAPSAPNPFIKFELPFQNTDTPPIELKEFQYQQTSGRPVKPNTQKHQHLMCPHEAGLRSSDGSPVNIFLRRQFHRQTMCGAPTAIVVSMDVVFLLRWLLTSFSAIVRSRVACKQTHQTHQTHRLCLSSFAKPPPTWADIPIFFPLRMRDARMARETSERSIKSEAYSSVTTHCTTPARHAVAACLLFGVTMPQKNNIPGAWSGQRNFGSECFARRLINPNRKGSNRLSLGVGGESRARNLQRPFDPFLWRWSNRHSRAISNPIPCTRKAGGRNIARQNNRNMGWCASDKNIICAGGGVAERKSAIPYRRERRVRYPSPTLGYFECPA